MITKHIFLSTLLILTLLPATTLAGGFVPLVGVPGIGTNIDFSDYINAIYALAISIAALLAVVKLVLAGAQYMLSDIVTSKQSAKEDIKGALIGLLIVIAAVLILSTINDDITDFAIGAPTFTYEGTPSNPSGNTGGNGGGGGGGGNPAPQTVFTSCGSDQACQNLRNTCNAGGGQVVEGSGSVGCTPPADATDGNNAGGDGETTGGDDGALEIDIGEGSDTDSENEAIDTTTVYTINDPADPDIGLDAGLDHNQSIRVTEDQTGATEGMVRVEFTESGEVRFYGCRLISPTPPEC